MSSVRSWILVLAAVSGWTSAEAQVTRRVSLSSAGAQPDALCSRAAISPTGRWVAFESFASNLIFGDGNDDTDVFLRDRQLNTTECISVAPNTSPANGASGVYAASAISADGRYVVFTSLATNIVAGDVGFHSDVFVRDRQSGTTERASVDSGGVQGDDDSGGGAISADGRFVAFQSAATNLIAGGTDGTPHVYVRDRQSGTTEIVSVDSGGALADNPCFAPSISADGRCVVFTSGATNLVAGDTNEHYDVFVRDRQAGTTEIVSTATGGALGNGGCFVNPDISADGRWVAFESAASNLVAGDVNGARDVFVHDRQTGTTVCASVEPNGFPSASHTSVDAPSISADGRYVAFYTYTSYLPSDTNDGLDVYVRDMQTSTSEVASVSSAVNPPPANGASAVPSLSDDGNLVAFESEANNLVPNDTNGPGDVFVRDRTDPGSHDVTSLCDPGAGGVAPCPCANPPSGPGRGCDNSGASGGAVLSAVGNTELASDAVVFTTSGEMPSVLTILVQGNALVANGLVYNQGIRCVGGSLKRLYVKQASGGSITAPDFFGGDLPVSQRSAIKGDVIQPGQSRWYAAFYRDPAVLPGCPGALKVNGTQNLEISWSY